MSVNVFNNDTRLARISYFNKLESMQKISLGYLCFLQY